MRGMVSKYHSAFVLGLKQSLRKSMPFYEETEMYVLAILDSRLNFDGVVMMLKSYLESAVEKIAPTPTSQVEGSAEPPPKK